MSDFKEFPKIPRLFRDCIITEKIDGTNGQICIIPAGTITSGTAEEHVLHRNANGDILLAGSRNRWVTPENDNYGFARWVLEHQEELRTNLGFGTHYGEWWGAGIQRKYGLKEKRFSLFNTTRWNSVPVSPCHVVPVIYAGPFSTEVVKDCVSRLRTEGSLASPGFMNPEGVVVFHEAGQCFFKATLEKDEKPKGVK
jgi:hypothetical protein